MNANAYEILALAMRYVFAALILLIVLRALSVTMVDSKRAAQLRRLNPKTGIIGEFVVLEGDGLKQGKRFPVTLEGSIGASSRTDIRIRRNGLHARHAYYQMTPAGLYVRGHAGITLMDEDGDYVRERILADGDVLYIGRIEMMLVLHDATAAPSFNIEKRKRKPVHDQDEDDIFDFDADAQESFAEDNAYDELDAESADDIFFSNPAGNRRLYNADHPDEFTIKKRKKR